MANAKESESRAADIIKNWLRSRYTLEFLGTWEQINNPDIKVVEFDHFKSQAGLPSLYYAVFINEKIPQKERLIKLNQIAIQQMSVLRDVESRKLLK